MKYRCLGAIGPRVSPIWLDAKIIGGRTAEAASGKIIGAARDAGINCINTADAYTNGESERIVGKFLRRDHGDFGADRPSVDTWLLRPKIPLYWAAGAIRLI